MLVWKVDDRLDPTMVVPVPLSGEAANVSNVPVIQAECSDT